MKNKKIIITALTLLCVTTAFSQFSDQSSEITSKITEIGKVIYKLVYAIAALAGIAGGISIAWAYWNNKENAPDLLKKWIIGFVIIILLGFIIQMFTGVDFKG